MNDTKYNATSGNVRGDLYECMQQYVCMYVKSAVNVCVCAKSAVKQSSWRKVRGMYVVCMYVCKVNVCVCAKSAGKQSLWRPVQFRLVYFNLVSLVQLNVYDIDKVGGDPSSDAIVDLATALAQLSPLTTW